MDKKTELEMKKAKLAEMRKLRETKMSPQLASQRTSQVGGEKIGLWYQLTTSSSSSIATTSIDVDPDSILIECGITTPVQTSLPVINGPEVTLSRPSLGTEGVAQKTGLKNQKLTKLYHIVHTNNQT